MTTKTKTTKAATQDTTAVTTKMAEGAREFVKRSTHNVQERVDGVYDSTKTYNTQIEDTLKRAASGYANILGSIAEAAYANVNHTLAAVEKLAEAKSVQEALQIQADYVREHSAQNMEHARNAFEYVREVSTENAAALREGYAKVMPKADAAEEKKAA